MGLLMNVLGDLHSPLLQQLPQRKHANRFSRPIGQVSGQFTGHLERRMYDEVYRLQPHSSGTSTGKGCFRCLEPGQKILTCFPRAG